jgi:hypothetical protein
MRWCRFPRRSPSYSLGSTCQRSSWPSVSRLAKPCCIETRQSRLRGKPRLRNVGKSTASDMHFTGAGPERSGNVEAFGVTDILRGPDAGLTSHLRWRRCIAARRNHIDRGIAVGKSRAMLVDRIITAVCSGLGGGEKHRAREYCAEQKDPRSQDGKHWSFLMILTSVGAVQGNR